MNIVTRRFPGVKNLDGGNTTGKGYRVEYTKWYNAFVRDWIRFQFPKTYVGGIDALFSEEKRNMDAQRYYLFDPLSSLSIISYFALLFLLYLAFHFLCPSYKNDPVIAVLCSYRAGTYVRCVVILFDSALRRALG